MAAIDWCDWWRHSATITSPRTSSSGPTTRRFWWSTRATISFSSRETYPRASILSLSRRSFWTGALLWWLPRLSARSGTGSDSIKNPRMTSAEALPATLCNTYDLQCGIKPLNDLRKLFNEEQFQIQKCYTYGQCRTEKQELLSQCVQDVMSRCTC